jgi:hypothetical protein
VKEYGVEFTAQKRISGNEAIDIIDELEIFLNWRLDGYHFPLKERISVALDMYLCTLQKTNLK